MDWCTGRTWRISKRLVAFLYILMTAFSLSAQDQKEKKEDVQIFVYPDKHITGKRITLSYVIPREYLPGLTVSGMEHPSGLDTIITPQVSPFDLETPEGVISATRIKMIYRSLKRGIYIIKPFTVEGYETPVQLPEVVLPVVDYDERNFGYPLSIAWADTLPKSIYTGQTIPLVLLLENMETLSFPDVVKFSTPRNSFLEKVALITEIDSRILMDKALYNVPVETWMLTPSQPGRLNIPAAEVKIGKISRWTSPFSIEIKPLPEAVQQTGAVGDFSFSSSLSLMDSEESDTVVLDVLLSGSGNFNYLKIPEPVIEDLVLLRKNEEFNIESSLKGYTGSLKVSYILQAEKAGTYNIKIPAFRWLDPSTGRIGLIRSENLSIDIEEKSGEEDISSFHKAKLLNLKAVQLHGLRFNFSNGYMYLIILPGILYLLLVLFFRKFGKKEVLFFSLVSILFFSGASAFLSRDYDQNVLEGLESFDKGSFQDAITSFNSALEKAPENPALLYNMGLLFENVDNPAQAAYYYRKSLMIRPWLSSSRKGILRLEKRYILEHQFPLPTRINEELLFFLSLISVNGILFGISFYIRQKRVRDVILILSFSLILLPLLGVMTFSQWERSRPYAVVGESGGKFNKVPGEKASDWLTLTPGTTVLIQAQVDDYFQVRTGYNVKGWLRKEEIISLSEQYE